MTETIYVPETIRLTKEQKKLYLRARVAYDSCEEMTTLLYSDGAGTVGSVPLPPAYIFTTALFDLVTRKEGSLRRLRAEAKDKGLTLPLDQQDAAARPG